MYSYFKSNRHKSTRARHYSSKWNKQIKVTVSDKTPNRAHYSADYGVSKPVTVIVDPSHHYKWKKNVDPLHAEHMTKNVTVESSGS